MNCRRAEELFSDEREGVLAPPIERELSAHLDTCDECRGLYQTFQEVTDALGAMSVPASPFEPFEPVEPVEPVEIDVLTEKLVVDLAPSARTDLTALTALTALRKRREVTRFTAPSQRLVAGASWLAAAAVFAMVFLFRPPELASELSKKTSRTARHVYSFAIRTYDQTERWIEDLNVLRMTVSVAFEDRLDQLNEQLRDLEDAGRRSTEDADEQSRRHRESEDVSGSHAMATRNDLGILSQHSSRSLL